MHFSLKEAATLDTGTSPKIITGEGERANGCWVF